MSLLIDRLPLRIREHEALGQFVRYAIVGCLNVALFFAILNGLLGLGAPIGSSAAVAYLVTNVVSFVLNKRWSFRDASRGGVVRQYLVFLALTSVGLGLYEAALHLLLIPLGQYGRLGENLAALCALPVSVLWNFNAYRRWAFNKAP